MRLSALQSKEIIDIVDGKKVGKIIDIVIDPSTGKINSMVIERGFNRKILSSKEEYEVKWMQILKIGEDIILVDTKNKN